MLRKAPSYILSQKIFEAPIKYKWNNEFALRFYAAKDQNVRLYEAIDLSNFKAKMALGIAITEWIIWRFKNYLDLEDADMRIEAAWSGVIDPIYVKTLEINLSPEIHDSELVKGPYEIGLKILRHINARYTKGDIYLAEYVVNQSMLARHIMPDKEIFSDWLTDTVKKTSTVFPRETEYDEETGIYDATHEKPVPREFFDPSFVYTEETAQRVLKDFLQTLNPKENPYLNSPEEMKKQGFKGKPYTL
ncbi:MAG: hypothetical protein AB7T38_17745 [Nitrospirales bacterium]